MKGKTPAPKPKVYTQAQVDRLVAKAKKDAANPIPKPKAQARMRKRIAEEKMDANMRAGARQARGKK